MSAPFFAAITAIGSQQEDTKTSSLANKSTPLPNPSQKVLNCPFFFIPIRNSQTPLTSDFDISEGLTISCLPDSFK